ncbi:MAG: hypothetical protein PHR22_01205 [Candidatus Omnitrophica bacterium]|nr:hypothetical protein [Candidatus Omnitrophota bacterium]
MYRFVFLPLFVFFAAFVFNGVYADVFELKTGEIIDGKITKETKTGVTVKLRNTTGSREFPKSQIKSERKEVVPEEQLYSTKEDQYFLKAKKIDTKDANAQLELAEWCRKNATDENGLLEMAMVHFRIAERLDPEVVKKERKDLSKAEEKAAEKIFFEAEKEFKQDEYIKSERLILSAISMYPNSKSADNAEKLLVKIWGRRLATKVLQAKDGLPEVAINQDEIAQITAWLAKGDLQERYFMKCLDKAMDFEERAKQVSRGDAQGYYILAIECYKLLLISGDPKLESLAHSKFPVLMKEVFKDTPVPSSYRNYMYMSDYLGKLEDAGLVEKISGKYFKTGEDLYKKARKSKQPEKAAKANSAYLCFSITNNFSKDEDLKQKALNGMIESQRIARALK